MNRLLEAGYWRYKYTICASGIAAATVIHDGEQLVGLYFGIWKLNVVSLEESRPDTLWVKPEDSGKLAFALNNFVGLQDKIQMVDNILRCITCDPCPETNSRKVCGLCRKGSTNWRISMIFRCWQIWSKVMLR